MALSERVPLGQLGETRCRPSARVGRGWAGLARGGLEPRTGPRLGPQSSSCWSRGGGKSRVYAPGKS